MTPSPPPGELAPQQRDVPDVAELTRAMTAGSEDAYRAFYAGYGGRLARYLLVVVRGDEHAVSDILQETLRRVVKHIRVFSADAAFWGWLTVLARSAAVDHRRKHRRYFSFLDRFRATEPLAAAGTDSADETLSELLDAELAMLVPDERELVELKYLQQMPTRVIAAQLGATEGSIESRLVRIRKKLRENVLARLTHES